jgi:DNA (cytosine-5)-methyltransferase 1
LSSLGGECVLSVEIDRDCHDVYQQAFSGFKLGKNLIGDIRSLTTNAIGQNLSEEEVAANVPDHDVLCAGFPCQPFSKSGGQLGVLDKTRGTLFFDIMTIVRAKQPKFLVLENVRNLAGPRHTDTWVTIIASIRDAGYKVSETPVVLTPHLIPPTKGGAPQVRDRIFILCERVNEDCDLSCPPLLGRNQFSDVWSPHEWHSSDILEEDRQISNIQDYRLSVEENAWLEAWDYFVQKMPADILPGFPIWVDSFQRVPDIEDETPKWKANFLQKNSELYRDHKAFLDGWLKRKWGKTKITVSQFPPSRRRFEWQARKTHPDRSGRTIRDLIIQMRPSGIRVKPASYFPALVAITQTSIVGPDVLDGIEEFRKLTPHEAAKLQGISSAPFAKAEKLDKVVFKQLGNLVNVGVVRLAAETLFESAGDPFGVCEAGVDVLSAVC